MTTVDYDALALEVADAVLVESTEKSICEFARRYRAALAEKMEPMFWQDEFGNIERAFKPWMSDEVALGVKWTPLYSLEDWKS